MRRKCRTARNIMIHQSFRVIFPEHYAGCRKNRRRRNPRGRRRNRREFRFSGTDGGPFSYNLRPFCAESGTMSTMPETLEPTPAEAVIIGAGPVGLFQIFELGLLGIKSHIIDSLAQPGGQCTELYPDKPIYDIPALPICGAQELIDRLIEQAKPFHATFHLGQEVTELNRCRMARFSSRRRPVRASAPVPW